MVDVLNCVQGLWFVERMKRFVEAEDSSEDEVVVVPFVKPKPPVILLSGSEGEDGNEGSETDGKSVERTETESLSPSPPSKGKGKGRRGGTESPSHTSQSSKSKEKKSSEWKERKKSRKSCEETEKDIDGCVDEDDLRSPNVEPGSVEGVRGRETLLTTNTESRSSSHGTPGSGRTLGNGNGNGEVVEGYGEDSSLPRILISSNIFDPSLTAISETETSGSPAIETHPPTSTSTPVRGGGRRSRTPTNTNTPTPFPFTPRGTNGEGPGTSSKVASESSFVSFLKSINLPVPDEFLLEVEGGSGKKKRGPRKGKAGRSNVKMSNLKCTSQLDLHLLTNLTHTPSHIFTKSPKRKGKREVVGDS